jgi:7 transmembrane helices usually fused to an inactive transglutaminase/Transglutaminase-like superfamily
MSRTRLAVVTAGLLAAASLAMMAARYRVLGPEVKRPHGPDTWKVTMLVQGRSTGGARLVTTTPLDGPCQHVVREHCHGDGFTAKPQEKPAPGRRSVQWAQRPGAKPGPFRARYDCYVTVAAPRTEGPDDPPPKRGEHLQGEPGIDADDPAVADLARAVTASLDAPGDQTQALYRYVEAQIADEPSLAGSALGAAECLKRGAGDSAAKSRLLAALCRSRGVPARLVTGLTLTKDDEQLPHAWVEAWVRDRWLPMCPFYRHYGRVPRTFLVFAYDDTRLARGRNVRGLACAFLVSRVPATPAAGASWPRRLFTALTLYHLPPAEQRLVEFLLLLPVAALVICVFRNVIGVASFGTFAPALVGLVFRDLHSLPGIAVFVGLILAGWLLRRRLDRFHLLQVPRTALLLSLVVVMLVGVIVVASRLQIAVTKSVSLFPVIILTGMVERFWTLEEEDGVRGSFRTLLGTLVIATTVALVVSIKAVVQTLFRYPEALGVVMAAQLLLGRYTGYRLSELLRFRDVLDEAPAVPVDVLNGRVLAPVNLNSSPLSRLCGRGEIR